LGDIFELIFADVFAGQLKLKPKRLLVEWTDACVPPVSAKEAVRTVVEYLEAHSEQLDERALLATCPLA